MRISTHHPLVLHAAVQDLLAAVWELQDLMRDLQRETQALHEALADTKTPP